jgi:HK97 family phage prohead protease
VQTFYTFVSRAEVADSGLLVGYASVFGVPTTRQQQFAGTETIARGAYDACLSDDVVALVDHDPTKLLGRSASGTLRLSSDDHGLRFEVDLPDTTLGRDVRELVRRGDLAGCSFSAAIGDVERVDGGVVHRSFKRLVDVSVVTFPAYPETSVVARHATQQSLRAQLASIRASVLLKGMK